MASYTWTGLAANGATGADPTLGANWTKSDGTTGTAPGAGDDVFIQAVPGLALADIAAAGGANLPAPGTPTTSGAASTGGNLAQSTTYYYKIAAISSAAGIYGEGPLSGELAYAVPASGTATNQITLNWAAVAGATGYKIYRGTVTGAELYLASVGAVLTYADTTATAPAGAPPATVTFASLNVSATYTGKIGAPGVAGYWKQPATIANIGTPGAATGGGLTASGGRIKLDFGTVAVTANVFASGSAVDTGYEPIILKGTNANNILNAIGGTVGIATALPGEAATLKTINVSGATVHLGSGVSWGASGAVANVSAGGALTADNGAAAATLNVANGATATVKGTATVGTANVFGTAALNNRPSGTNVVDTLNLYPGGTADFGGNPAAGTVGTLNFYAGTTATTLIRNAANPAHITLTALNYLGGGTLSFSS